MMPIPTNGKQKAQGLRQSMAGLHIWVGLLAGWILYAMFLTGTVSYFREEITQWMQPEIPAIDSIADSATIVQRMTDTLAEIAPYSSQWTIDLPGLRSNTVSAMWRTKNDFERAVFDPITARKIISRDTVGGEFFYYFHFSLHYFPRTFGRWITGLCAMFMLVAIVTGVIIHKKIFADFFTFRWGKGQRSWLDAHNAFSVLGLPFHLMITYTGLIMLMFMYMPWGSNVALKAPQDRLAMTTEMRALVVDSERTGAATTETPIAMMFASAEERWGKNNVGRAIISNFGDSSARIMLVRGNLDRVSTSPQYILFDGPSGNILRTKDQTSAAIETWGVMYGLHMGRFADTVTRWLYFLISLAGTAMVGTGLVLWTVKRGKKLNTNSPTGAGLCLVRRLNITCIAGTSIAMAVFFWGNRLLPIDLEKRADWEIHLFFIAWGLSFLHASIRPVKRAWLEQLVAAAVLLALLPVLNAMTSERGIINSILANDWVFVGFDVSVLIFAAFHILFASRMNKDAFEAA